MSIFYKEPNAPIRKKQRIVMSLRAFVFCKPILPIFYKEPNAPIRNKATHLHVIACVCIFVNPSHRVRLYFGIPILPIFYKEPNAPILKKKQRLVMSSRAFGFLETHHAFSKHFSTSRSPSRVLTSLKRASCVRRHCTTDLLFCLQHASLGRKGACSALQNLRLGA